MTRPKCAEYGIVSSQLFKWRKALLEGGSLVFKEEIKSSPCSKMKCNPLEYLLKQIQDGVADEEIPPIVL
jgi:transposase-like protein